MNQFLLLRIAFFSVVVLVGCGGDQSSLSLAGTATIDGVPMPDAMLEFSPVEAGSTLGGAIARTDAQGNFQIASDERRRLKAGKYGVRVSKWVHKKTRQPVSAEEAEQYKLAGLAYNVIPLRYSAPGTKPAILLDLKAGTNTGVKIEVASK